MGNRPQLAGLEQSVGLTKRLINGIAGLVPVPFAGVCDAMVLNQFATDV
jgi:hypothetical protein